MTSSPMPDFIKMAGTLIEMAEASRECIRSIKIICVAATPLKTEDDYQRGRKDMAIEILESLGYTVDHWFCGTAILKRIEVPNEREDER